jgi:hypothetical protein
MARRPDGMDTEKFQRDGPLLRVAVPQLQVVNFTKFRHRSSFFRRSNVDRNDIATRHDALLEAPTDLEDVDGSLAVLDVDADFGAARAAQVTHSRVCDELKQGPASKSVASSGLP